MGKKYISFSLFGNSALYCYGAIENIECAKKFYPDWICRFYVSGDCPALNKLRSLDCEVVEMNPLTGVDRNNDRWQWNQSHVGMFWRYFILDEMGPDDVVIFRDCDSRLSKREADVVNDWLTTEYPYHRIAENACHRNSFFMGGMWGCRGNRLNGISDAIEEWIDIYSTMNHPLIFIDLEFHNQVLAPALYTKTIGYGYELEKPLPPLVDKEKPIGWVIDEHLRNEVYHG